MNQENEKRLTDAIIDLGVTVTNLSKEVHSLGSEVKELRGDVRDLKAQQVKTNLALGEMRTSYMKLDARVEKLDESVNNRISKLDDSINVMRTDLNGKIDFMSSSLNKYAESNNSLVKNHETRIVRLERKTFGNSYPPAGQAGIVSEPKAKYKRKKRK